MFKKIIISIFMVGSLAFAPAAFAEPVILVFDVDRAIAMSKAGKSMAKQLEEQVTKVRADEGEVLKGLQSEAEKPENSKNYWHLKRFRKRSRSCA